MGMTAGKRIAGCTGNGRFYGFKGEIQNPGPRDPESDFQTLYSKTGQKIRKSKFVGQTFIAAPKEPADDSNNKKLLSDVSDGLKDKIPHRGTIFG